MPFQYTLSTPSPPPHHALQISQGRSYTPTEYDIGF